MPAAQAVVVLPFARLGDAAIGAQHCLESELGRELSVCDLYDWRLLSLARDADSRFHDWIAEAAESVLIIEFEGDAQDEVAGKARMLIERINHQGLLNADPVTVFRRADCEQLVALRRLTEPLLTRSRSRSRPLAIVDDLAVPPDRLALVVRQLQDRLKRHGVMWTMNAYAGDGRIRLRPFLDLADPGDRARLEPLVREIYDLVIEAGGTISGSQGCGLARTQFLPRQFGELVQVFREIKDAFDPSNLFNPGKIIGDDPHLMVRDLKRFPALPQATDQESGSLLIPSTATGSGSHRPIPADKPLESGGTLNPPPGEMPLRSLSARSSCRFCAGQSPVRWQWPRPATAAANAATWTPPCECARAIELTAARRRHLGHRLT